MHAHDHDHDTHEIDLNEKFEFSSKAKRSIFIIFGLGIVLTILGLVMAMSGGHGHGEHHGLLDAASIADAGAGEAAAAEHHSHTPVWLKRLYTNLWINNVFFTGIALIGMFFVAVQYVATAGWSAGLKRIPEAFGAYLPIAFVLMVAVFFAANHDLFHWTHAYLYDTNSPHFDQIINGKKGFFFWPGEAGGLPLFYISRMFLFFLVWIGLYYWMRSVSLAEDLQGGFSYYRKLVKLSALFIVFFGISSSASAWDWVMSIDTHWFSTMFGWYVFASWFVTGLSIITYIVIGLKDAGYLKFVTESHLHDLGKFVFAFSVFWTYIWFSQFLLIYYANIPEETIYFIERLQSDYYGKFIFINLFLNFFFPFLALMTRDAKRKIAILRIVTTVVVVGHWLDFYLMITPGVMKEDGAFGFLEIGLPLVYGSVFAFVVLTQLSKAPLIAKNHPMIQESLHHHA